MILAFGLAILLTCLIADRQSRPFALILAAGWLSGLYAQFWWPLNPLISTVSSFVFLTIYLHTPKPLPFALAGLAFFMLCMDLVYAVYLGYGVWIGPIYDLVLCVCLAAQLALVGRKGVKNGLHRLGEWVSGRFGRRRVLHGARRDQTEFP